MARINAPEKRNPVIDFVAATRLELDWQNHVTANLISHANKRASLTNDSACLRQMQSFSCLSSHQSSKSRAFDSVRITRVNNCLYLFSFVLAINESKKYCYSLYFRQLLVVVAWRLCLHSIEGKYCNKGCLAKVVNTLTLANPFLAVDYDWVAYVKKFTAAVEASSLF